MFWQELAKKIRGYQEQIASLHSKCKMLTVKAKHATMLLTVNEVEGLSDGVDELSDEELPGSVATTNGNANKQLPAHPSVVMVSGAAFYGLIHRDSHMHKLHGCMHCVCVCMWGLYSFSLSVQTTGSQQGTSGILSEFLVGVYSSFHNNVIRLKSSLIRE